LLTLGLKSLVEWRASRPAAGRGHTELLARAAAEAKSSEKGAPGHVLAETY
jgi:sulfate transport system permease protein